MARFSALVTANHEKLKLLLSRLWGEVWQKTESCIFRFPPPLKKKSQMNVTQNVDSIYNHSDKQKLKFHLERDGVAVGRVEGWWTYKYISPCVESSIMLWCMLEWSQRLQACLNSAVDRGKWQLSRPGPLSLWYPLNKKLSVHWKRTECFGEDKKIFALLIMKSTFLGRSARSLVIHDCN